MSAGWGPYSSSILVTGLTGPHPQVLRSLGLSPLLLRVLSIQAQGQALLLGCPQNRSMESQVCILLLGLGSTCPWLTWGGQEKDTDRDRERGREVLSSFGVLALSHQGPLAVNKAPLGRGGSHLAYGPQEMPVVLNQPSLGCLSPWVSS